MYCIIFSILFENLKVAYSTEHDYYLIIILKS